MSPYGAAEKTGTLMDAVTSVRSKNAGPFTLTFDLFFPNEEQYNDVVDRNVVTKEKVAKLYGIAPSDVRIFPFQPALAIKVSIPRLMPGGSPGDTDVAGGQQFVPLLDLPL
jgi:hypothetical protein